MSYADNRRFGDKFMRQVSGLLGQALIMPAPKEEDCERNTDLMVLGMNSVRIGCRVRKNHYLKPYGCEFTVRALSPMGMKTEISKIIEGWGDYMFYGFASPCETHLVRWTIISLNEFRIWHSREMYRLKGGMPGVFKKNPDGSALYSFDLTQMPRELVVADNWLYLGNQAA